MTRVKAQSSQHPGAESTQRKVTVSSKTVKKPASPNTPATTDNHLEQTSSAPTISTNSCPAGAPQRFLLPNLKVKRALGKGMLSVFEVVNILTDKCYAAKVYPSKTTIQSAQNEFTLMRHIHKSIKELKDVPQDQRQGLSAYVTPNTAKYVLKAYHKLEVSEKQVLLLELFVDEHEEKKTRKPSRDLFDYVNEQPKLEFMQGGNVDEDEAKYIFRQMLEGVVACHAFGVVHYDIKLENFLIQRIPKASFGPSFYFAEEDEEEEEHSDDEDDDETSEQQNNKESETAGKRRLGEKRKEPFKRFRTTSASDIDLLDESSNKVEHLVKMIDFGFARKYDSSEKIRSCAGSPAYASPEVLFGSLHSPVNADIWSLGVCLFRMVTGKFPFCDPELDSLAILKANVRYYISSPELFSPSTSSFVPEYFELSPELRDLLGGMLHPQEQHRLSLSDILSHPWLAKDILKESL
eukprot:TRINITY_DN1422_c0_g1_i1.p1 TRINITY_DN1422_c0_g1~~TRINITY_DN1422_c0_g1_i1.p1  ORF type:complete len:464 (+),score=112.43 TRINITY_DN1422_c0_g1_i1:2666-4057(+)